MAKERSRFVCQGCGYTSPRWLGRCPECDAWDSFVEEAAPVRPALLELFMAEGGPRRHRRGLFRTQYEGDTLRALYGLPRPDVHVEAGADERLKDSAST